MPAPRPPRPRPAHPPATGRIPIDPPLTERERQVLVELTGAPGSAHRIWLGQPGRRSPWTPCDDGCCLVLRGRDPLAAAWARFLVQEVLAPRAPDAVARSSAHGLPGRSGLLVVVRLPRSRTPLRIGADPADPPAQTRRASSERRTAARGSGLVQPPDGPDAS